MRPLTGTIDDRLATIVAAGEDAARDPSVIAWTWRQVGDAATIWDACARVQRAVQRLPYLAHPENRPDFVREGAETITDGGDCQDRAALLVAADRVLGIPVRVEWQRQRGARIDHVTVLCQPGVLWRWQDGTIAAELGEEPHDAARRLGQRQVEKGIAA